MVDSPRTPPPVSRKVRVAGFWARGRTVWYKSLSKSFRFRNFSLTWFEYDCCCSSCQNVNIYRPVLTLCVLDVIANNCWCCFSFGCCGCCSGSFLASASSSSFAIFVALLAIIVVYVYSCHHD